MISSPDTKRSSEGSFPDEQEVPSEQNTIVIENEALRKGFTIVPNYILSDTDVSFGARLSYMLLLSYAWKEGSCFPGQDKLAEDLGVTRKAVNKYLSELKDAKYVSWDRRGLGRTNIYYILNRQTVDTPKKQPANKERKPSNNTSSDVTKRLHQNVTTGSHQEVTKRLHYKYTEENDTKEQQHVVAEKLRSLGVSEKMVHELVSVHTMHAIQEKLALLEWKMKNGKRAIQDEAAWIVKAIVDNYALPADFLEAKRKSEQKVERQKRLRSLKKQIGTQNQTESSKENQEDQKLLMSLMDKYGTTAQEKSIWVKARTNLESLTDIASYKLWLMHTELLRLKDGKATVYAQNTVVKQQIENRFIQVLSQAICMAIGDDHDLQIVVITPTE